MGFAIFTLVVLAVINFKWLQWLLFKTPIVWILAILALIATQFIS